MRPTFEHNQIGLTNSEKKDVSEDRSERPVSSPGKASCLLPEGHESLHPLCLHRQEPHRRHHLLTVVTWRKNTQHFVNILLPDWKIRLEGIWVTPMTLLKSLPDIPKFLFQDFSFPRAAFPLGAVGPSPLENLQVSLKYSVAICLNSNMQWLYNAMEVWENSIMQNKNSVGYSLSISIIVIHWGYLGRYTLENRKKMPLTLWRTF